MTWSAVSTDVLEVKVGSDSDGGALAARQLTGTAAHPDRASRAINGPLATASLLTVLQSKRHLIIRSQEHAVQPQARIRSPMYGVPLSGNTSPSSIRVLMCR